MIRSKYFRPHELIEPSILKLLKDELAMCLVGQFVCDSLDKLREEYEEAVRCAGDYNSPRDAWIVINGKWYGEKFQYSGVRSKTCKVVAKHSKHKIGIAFDLKCDHLDTLLWLIENHWENYNISRIENPDITVPRGWIHVEFGFEEELKVFNP